VRFRIPVGDVYQQLRGISSDRAVGFGENKVLSVPDAIAQALGLHQCEKAGIQQELIPEVVGGATEVMTLPETLEQPQLSPAGRSGLGCSIEYAIRNEHGKSATNRNPDSAPELRTVGRGLEVGSRAQDADDRDHLVPDWCLTASYLWLRVVDPDAVNHLIS
jgi:hypothetical protein